MAQMQSTMFFLLGRTVRVNQRETNCCWQGRAGTFSVEAKGLSCSFRSSRLQCEQCRDGRALYPKP